MSDHLPPSPLPPDDELFRRLRIPWQRSSDQAWAELAARLPHTRRQVSWLRVYGISSAAAILLLSLLVGVAYNYQRHYQTTASQHQHVRLPDGSLVWVNADSQLSYRPLWWWAQRSVRMEGEAYFEVEKGSRFVVASLGGRVQVLGTRFNVRARQHDYEVSCLSGRVQVSSPDSRSAVVLTAAQKARRQEGKLLVEPLSQPDNEQAWRQRRFVFTARPLGQVLDEIERQYGVRIQRPTQMMGTYTGNFEQKIGVEACLELICRPFGLKAQRLADDTYRIEK